MDKIIIRDIIYRFEHMAMECQQRNRISKRVLKWLKAGKARQVQRIVAEVEAMHVHAIAKSIVTGQKDDPMILRMVEQEGLKNINKTLVDIERFDFEEPYAQKFDQDRADEYKESKKMIA